ncbi:13052_t:CDS:2, partial [Ambispora leptoticha]
MNSEKTKGIVKKEIIVLLAEKNANDKQKLLKSFKDLDNYYQKNEIEKIDYNPSYFTVEIRITLTSYFVDNHNTSLSRQQLGSMISRLQSELKEEKKPTNYMPYILGGIGVVLVIVVIAVVYLLGKRLKDSFYSNKKVRYISEIAGRLELSINENQPNKFFQDFSQNIYKFELPELVKFEEPLEKE